MTTDVIYYITIEVIMGTVSYSFRIDNETKEEFDEICQIMGMSSATAFNMFAKRVVAERALPFTPTAIPSAKRSATEALRRNKP